MQIRVAVLTLAGLAGTAYVGGVLFFAHSLTGRAALVAFAALAAYAVARPEPAESALDRASGGAARTGRTRSAVPVALGVLAIGIGVIVEKDVSDVGWFSYAPLSQPRPVSLDWSVALTPHHRLAVGLFVAAVLFVLAATLSPERGPKRVGLLSLALLPAAGYVVVRAIVVAGRQPAGTGPALTDLTLGAWAFLLAAIALAVAAALGRGWLFTIGAVLVALVALRFVDVALGLMPVRETGVAFLEPGMIAQAAPPVGLGRDWAGALAAAALFAGGLLAVLGLTRRSAPAVVLPEDPGDGVEA